MAIEITNNALSTLASSILSGDGSCTVQTGHGSRFPVLSGTKYFYATLESSGGTIEIVKVTARSGDVMTITRAQEGTSASAFNSGSAFELRPTRQNVVDLASTAGAEAGLIYTIALG